MRISALFLICGSLALNNTVLAQDAADEGETTDVTLSDLIPEVSAFDQLSPDNQKVAESLFGGQSIPENSTGQAWSLDRIAAASQDGQGWGKVFKQMKADGLVDAKNLGQLVSGGNEAFRSDPGTRSEIVVTTGRGRKLYFGRSRHSNRGTESLNSGKGSPDSGSGRSSHASGRKFSGFSGSWDPFSGSGPGGSGGTSGRGHGRK